jgi:hypothetical protein
MAKVKLRAGAALLPLSLLLSLPALGQTNKSGTQHAVGNFSRITTNFERNVGQADPKVLYLARTAGSIVSLGRQEIYVTVAGSKHSSATDPQRSGRPVTVRFGFSGSNPSAILEPVGLTRTATNYYVGRNSSSWRLGVPSYEEVRYLQLFPGVDAIFRGTWGRLEYDFVLAPGADARAIKMDIGGLKARVAQGWLFVETDAGILKFAPPTIYQDQSGQREYVRGGFVLIDRHRVGFKIGAYDHRRPLTIDPVLSYSTYLTGSNDTTPAAVSADLTGEIYVTGGTFATDFPVTSGTFGGSEDVFVSKISAAGTTLVFSTYLGGAGFDTANGMVVDRQGYAYIVGNTGSSNFPTTPGAFRTACPSNFLSCNAPFVAKFDPTGTMIYSTLLSVGANARAIGLDAQGSAYIAGDVSGNILDVVNPFESTYQGIVSTSAINAFLQKLDASGSSLLYGTYLAPTSGASGIVNTTAVGIAVDTNGSAYVTGSTNATNFPTKNSSLTLDATHGVYVAKFKPDGSDLIYSASFSGSATDTPTGIALDPQNDAYITGTVGSTDFPTTPSAFMASCISAGTGSCTSPNIFVSEVAPDGSTLLYSTLVGQGNAGGIAVDTTGRAFITGSTIDPSFPTISPVQSTLQVSTQSNTDAFVTALDNTGTPFFSTFLGGIGTDDAGTAISVNSTGETIYVAGTASGASNQTSLIDFPMVNPGETFLPCCGVSGGFVSTLQLVSSAPLLSVAPQYAPFVVLRNVGSAPLSISAITSTGSITPGGTCAVPQTLPAGGECFLIVSAGTLTVASNAAGSPQQFSILQSLVGFGPPGFFLISSLNSVQFPARLLGTQSSAQVLTLTNAGNSPGSIDSISFVSGPFTQSSNCPATLAPGANCNIQISFSPTTSGAASGDLAIITQGTLRTDIFVGGLGSANALTVSTPSIEFGPQYVGTTYLSRTLVLTNVDVAPLTITGFSLSSPYSQTNNCSAQLAPGASCRVFVSFNPTANGDVPGAITVTHNSTGSSQTVQLDGTGIILSDLTVSPLQISFPGNTIIGHTGNPVILTLQNGSNTQLTISNVVLTPSVFSISANTCTAPLAPGATCTMTFTFTPTAPGPVTGSLTITHTGVGNPQIVSVQGSGVTQVLFTPSALDFGDQQVGTTSPQHSVSLGNNFNSPVTIQSLSISGNFQIASNSCPLSPQQLQGYFGCSIQLTFSPTGTGTNAGTLTAVASDSPNPHTISLTGNGVSGGVDILPSTVNFGDVAVGAVSPATTLTLTNISGSSVTIQSVSPTGPFQQQNNCGTSVAAGGNCTIQVSFAPATTGSTSGILTVQDSAAGSPETVSLAGNGIGSSASLSPSSLNFGNEAQGSTAPAQTVKLTNQSTSALTITGISATGDFGQTNTCGASVGSGASCNINVTFTPSGVGARNGTLTVTDSAGQQVATLTGNGTSAPALTITPGSVNFGNVLAGQVSNAQNVTLNVTGAPLSIYSVAVSPSIFTVSNPCGSIVNGGNSCTLAVSVKPMTLGPVSGMLTVQDDAAGSPQTVNLQAVSSNFELQQNSGGGQVITAGQTANFNLTLASVSGVSETVQLTCGGLPAQSTCSFSQSSFVLNGSIQPFTLAIQTTARSTSTSVMPGVGGLWRGTDRLHAAPAILACWLLIGTVAGFLLWMGKGRNHSFGRACRFLVLWGFALPLALGIASCSGSSGTPPPVISGTPAGTYTLVIIGTSSNASDPAASIQLVFTVQ